MVRLLLNREVDAAIALAGQPATDAIDKTVSCFVRAVILAYRGEAASAVKLIKEATSTDPNIRIHQVWPSILRRQGEMKMAVLWEAQLLEYVRHLNTDVFLISYPKCGRTWLRYMLGLYLLGGRDGNPMDVYDISLAEPDFATIYVNHDDYPHWKPLAELETDKSKFADKKILFLVRDPRDVLVSNYFQYTKRGDKEKANDTGFDGSIGDFIDHEIGGLGNIIQFYNIWARNRNVPRKFQCLTYEDLHQNTKDTLIEMIEYLGWPATDARKIDDITARASFANMQSQEKEDGGGEGFRMRASDIDDPESFKMRRGKIGGYGDYLSEMDVARMDEMIRGELDDYYHFYKR
ncbi:MAG: sulfotransferase domain-containing protein [Rhodospirillales bacterium]|jgi:hypothetical protein|nr:sulfotransferase domain-containing protein [Rhodospirillales bacterium]MDP6642553.1 sulfotransferase domain-containing protein [Rhodospirillales bacterium]MDP6841844.1 sulfotransferase domain-containing protein [Rhodospirillales bacterium]|tara:strand:+ start:508 stop:1554 length:1047 start_codon:yes stop_codon:yes gene_type:complete